MLAIIIRNHHFQPSINSVRRSDQHNHQEPRQIKYMRSPSKVLAINFGGIGDEVLFLPTLSTVRKLLPEAKLTLLLEPRSRSITQVTDLIDEVITFDIKKKPLTPLDLINLLFLIRKGKYDLVISSGSSPMVAMLLYLSGIEIRIGYDSGPPWRELLTHRVKLNKNQYAADMYHDLTRGLTNFLRLRANAAVSLGADFTEAPLPMVALNNESLNNMKEALETEAESLTLALKKSGAQDGRPIKWVLLHPGTSKMAVSKGIIKHWPTKNWLELIENLSNQSNESFQTQVVLAGGPDDKEVIDELVKALEAKKREQSKRIGVLAGNSGSGHSSVVGSSGEVEDGQEHVNMHVNDINGDSNSHSAVGNLKLINMAGKTRGLSDLAALISICDLMVCVDSAPMHIGVGLKKKLVALFGPTEPEKLIPKSPDFAVLADRPNPANKAVAARHMFDGLGVKLEPERVYKEIINLLQ